MKAEQLKSALLLSLLVHLLLLQFLVYTPVPQYELRREYVNLLNLESFEVAEDASAASEAGLRLNPVYLGEQFDNSTRERIEEEREPEVEEAEESAAEIDNLPAAELTVIDPGRGSRSQQVVHPSCLNDDSDLPIPESLQNTSWEGAVTLEIYLDYDGSVIDVRVLRTSGREDADMAAVSFYRTTHWTPLLIDGSPYLGPRQVVVEKTVEFEQQI